VALWFIGHRRDAAEQGYLVGGAAKPAAQAPAKNP